MRETWNFALNNTHVLFVPAVGFILSLLILRIKKRYINEGVFFGRSTALPRGTIAPNSEEDNVLPSENEIDLSVALRKFHELAVSEGDLGHEYWHGVGQLLRRANEMQAQIDSLSKELEVCRAKLREN
jgi:hypothetical protein